MHPPLLDNGWRESLTQTARVLSGEITEDQWHEEIAAVIGPAYLAAATPWEASGKSGDVETWERGRRGVMAAIDRDGSFLDIGCANGYLMESIEDWAAEDGRQLQLHGVDIIPALAYLARERLPRHADRIWTGNALSWEPPRQFTFVRTGLEYVLPWRRYAYVLRLLTRVIEPGGRLIIGPMSEPVDQLLVQVFLNAQGLVVGGVDEQPHAHPQRRYRTYWLGD